MFKVLMASLNEELERHKTFLSLVHCRVEPGNKARSSIDMIYMTTPSKIFSPIYASGACKISSQRTRARVPYVSPF